MKVNFDRQFSDCFGGLIDGRKMYEQLCLHLFNLSSLKGTPVSPEDKYKAYRLCVRISKKPAEVELKSEEASFLKQVCAEILSAGAYGQIADMLDGKEE